MDRNLLSKKNRVAIVKNGNSFRKFKRGNVVTFE